VFINFDEVLQIQLTDICYSATAVIYLLNL